MQDPSIRRSGLVDATLFAGITGQVASQGAAGQALGLGEAIRQGDDIDRLPPHLPAEPAGPGELDEIDLLPLAEVARILQEEGYLESYEIVDGKVEGTKVLRMKLKYIGERRHRRPILTGLQRVSRPGCRVYASKDEIPWVLSGIGIAIISTPKGIMTGQRARKIGVGGEVLCKVW